MSPRSVQLCVVRVLKYLVEEKSGQSMSHFQQRISLFV
jgi:hypothetical protein